MVENIIIGLVFIAALVYLLNLVRTNFSAKNTGCAKGCGGACGGIDFKKIEAEIAKKEASAKKESRLTV